MKIKTRQKLGIGAFLCLSIIMIVLAIVKISGLTTRQGPLGLTFDLVWEVFWQQVEACVSIIMVSLTAFHSIFISNRPKINRKTVWLWHFPRVSIKSPTKQSFTDSGVSDMSTRRQRNYPDGITLGTRFHDAENIDLGRDSLFEPLALAKYESPKHMIV